MAAAEGDVSWPGRARAVRRGERRQAAQQPQLPAAGDQEAEDPPRS